MIYLDENDQMIIAEKDKTRRSNNKTKPNIKFGLEDVYKWIEFSFKKVENNTNLIVNCFHKAGISETFYQDAIEEEIARLDLIDISMEVSEVISDFKSSEGSDKEGNSIESINSLDLEFRLAPDVRRIDEENERAFYEQAMIDVLEGRLNDGEMNIERESVGKELHRVQDNYLDELQEEIRRGCLKKIIENFDRIYLGQSFSDSD